MTALRHGGLIALAAAAFSLLPFAADADDVAQIECSIDVVGGAPAAGFTARARITIDYVHNTIAVSPIGPSTVGGDTVVQDLNITDDSISWDDATDAGDPAGHDRGNALAPAASFARKVSIDRKSGYINVEWDQTAGVLRSPNPGTCVRVQAPNKF
jgi:hypothetical protein